MRIVYGIHPVMELVKASPGTVNEVRYSEGSRMKDLLALCSKAHIHAIQTDRGGVSRFANTNEHQGVAAMAQGYRYAEIDDILAVAKEANETPFILALDGINDPGNMGSMARSAYLLGIHGIIFPKDRNVQVTPAVCKASSGAIEHLKIAQVTNLARTLKELKDSGLWVVGTDFSDGKAPRDIDLKLPVVIVIGSEGEGMRRLTRTMCDFIATIPCRNAGFSFNASVAAALILAEAANQRASG